MICSHIDQFLSVSSGSRFINSILGNLLESRLLLIRKNRHFNTGRFNFRKKTFILLCDQLPLILHGILCRFFNRCLVVFWQTVVKIRSNIKSHCCEYMLRNAHIFLGFI